MAYTDFIAAIDLGSSHMVGMVGAKGPAGTLSIIAYEVENSDTCIRRGCVYNVEETANKIFDEKLSVRETEKLVKALKNPKKEVKKEKPEHTFIYENIEEQIKNIMGTKVSVNQKANGKGKIEIEYYSEEELERIYDLLMTIPRGE